MMLPVLCYSGKDVFRIADRRCDVCPTMGRYSKEVCPRSQDELDFVTLKPSEGLSAFAR
jgi:hypothetical protein